MVLTSQEQGKKQYQQTRKFHFIKVNNSKLISIAAVNYLYFRFMDILLLILGALLIMLGLAGSFLPVIPGPLTSWLGLLSLHYTSKVEQDWGVLGWTLIVALIIMALDYLIPIWGTKALGGTKAGAVGSTVGLVIGLFFPPFGIIFGPFVGALAGELSKNPDRRVALKAAFGSFLGFLTGVALKLIISFVYLLFFVSAAWRGFESWF